MRDRVSYPACEIGCFGVFGRPRIHIDDRFGECSSGERPACLAYPASCDVECDATQPCTKAIGIAEPVETHQRDDRGLLEYVFDRVAITREEPSAHAPRELPMAGQQVTERASVSLARARHQVSVTHTVVEVLRDAS
jgi:hypothetical protein